MGQIWQRHHIVRNVPPDRVLPPQSLNFARTRLSARCHGRRAQPRFARCSLSAGRRRPRQQSKPTKAELYAAARCPCPPARQRCPPRARTGPAPVSRRDGVVHTGESAIRQRRVAVVNGRAHKRTSTSIPPSKTRRSPSGRARDPRPVRLGKRSSRCVASVRGDYSRMQADANRRHALRPPSPRFRACASVRRVDKVRFPSFSGFSFADTTASFPEGGTACECAV